MKILFILNNIQKSLGIEWLISGLLTNNFELHVILMNKENSEMELFLKHKNIPVTRMYCESKADAPYFIFKLCRQIKIIKPDAVHTHLRDADLYGQTAAFLCNIKKRIYTRHSSTYNHLYHKKSVILDRFVNFLCTDIIAISEVTRQTLIQMENVNKDKITLIHHGFDLESFNNVNNQRIENIRSKYEIPRNSIVIGVFARYTSWKGYQYIIPAFASLKKKYPSMHFVFANTTGEYKPIIKKMLTDTLPQNSYTEIRFENDVQAFYKLLNYYVHVPVDKTVEAFGQTYVEALAAGIPSVFTLSGIANEFIVNERNALVVEHKNSAQITESIEKLIADKNLSEQLVKNGIEDVQQFNLDVFIKKSVDIYKN